MPTMNSGLGGPAGYGEGVFSTSTGATTPPLSGSVDDGSIALDITSVFGAGGLTFFGTSYTDIFINSNGVITFGSSFTTSGNTGGLGSIDLPAIAPFWADVDITVGGEIYWDLDPANDTVTITWLDVEPYSGSGTNSFQVVLTDTGGGDFDIEVIYEEIQWAAGNDVPSGNAITGITDGDSYNEEFDGSDDSAELLAYETNDFGGGDPNGTFVVPVQNGFPEGFGVDGTAGDDTMGLGYTDADGDQISTNGDLIFGGDGADSIDGDGGDDTIFGGAGDDSIEGGDPGPGRIIVNDNDVLTGTTGQDAYEWAGGAGSSATIHFSTSAAAGDGDGVADYVVVTTTDDADTLTIGDFDLDLDKIYIQENWVGLTTTLSTGTATYTLTYAGGNQQTFSIRHDGSTPPTTAAIFSTDAPPSSDGVDDIIYGDDGNDTISGQDGNDTVFGGDGNDLIYGDGGDDRLEGGTGSDVFYGDAGSDTFYGGDGDDALYGGAGADSIFGGGGSDDIYIEDGFGADTIDGGSGTQDDLKFVSLSTGITVTASGDKAGTATDGTDTLVYSDIEDIDGSNNNDVINLTADTSGMEADGFSGDDSIQGGSGDDDIDGDGGNDTLRGGAGRDVLSGGAGNDTLVGGAGNDTLTTGTGNDTIVFERDGSDDVITDFDIGDDDTDGFYNDQLDVSALRDLGGNPVNVGDVTVTDDGAGNARLSFPEGESIVLQGVTPAQMSSNAQLNSAGIPCFANGTRIATDQGEVAIEDLAVGHLVKTLDHGLRPIRWIGGRTIDRADMSINSKLRPIRIIAGALGQGMPTSDLLVSRQHRMLVASKITERMFDEPEVLVPAIKLVGLQGINIAPDVNNLTYFHILFDQHEVIWANGTPSESLHTGTQALKSLSYAARDEILTLFPDLASPGKSAMLARNVPDTGRAFKELLRRHAANGRPLLETFGGQ